MRTLYRWLLYLYPPAFRRAYGREMEGCVRTMAASSSSFIRLSSRVLADLLRSIPREWNAELRARSPRALAERRHPANAIERARTIMADIRFALRLLLRQPAFTLAAVATLALGIGANTAMLSLAEATLLRPVDVPRPHELVALPWSSSYPDYRDYATLDRVFTGVLATSVDRFNLAVDDTSELRQGAYLSGNAFAVLGIAASHGRPILPSDDLGPGAPVVAVLGHDYWRARFASDPRVVGRTIRVNNQPATIVGVAAPGFRGLTLADNPAIYFPVTTVRRLSTGFLARPAVLESRGLIWLTVVGRLRPGVDIDQAAQAMETSYRQHRPLPPRRDAQPFVLETLATRAIGGSNESAAVRRFVLLLVGVVGVTLLIGCANIANLLLARAARRRHELGVRVALGASRGRVLRQLLVENLTLGLCGGVAGLLVAGLGLRTLAAFRLPGGIAISDLSLEVDGSALAAAAALTLLTTLLFGTLPAWRAASLPASAAFRADERGFRRSARLRAGLVAAQVALSLVLLAGTGLFLRSLAQALQTPLGFDVDGVATASVGLHLAGYDAARARVFRREAADRVRAIPGVTAAGWTLFIPARGGMQEQVEAIEGYAPAPGEDITVRTPHVGAGYFAAAGTRILAGRPFDDGDGPLAPRVVIVNEAAAAKYWAGESALGGRLRRGSGSAWFTVIGVAENTIADSLRETPLPFVYFSIEQAASAFGPPLSGSLLVRTTGDVNRLLPRLRQVLRAIDPGAPVSALQPLAAQVRELVMPQRMGSVLFGFFGLLAVSLASLGIYGVASYVAALQTREIGVRMALGATRGDIGRLVLRQGTPPIALGVGIGLVLALWAARFAAGFLHDVTPHDPLTFGGVTALLTALAWLASYVPARRASRIDPATALRYE